MSAKVGRKVAQSNQNGEASKSGSHVGFTSIATDVAIAPAAASAVAAAVTSTPPAPPHITDNLTSLSDILRRQATHTYHELTTFMSSLSNSSKSDNEKKRTFLELLVALRENFVRLYVVAKWARSAEAVQTLIDLFAWLRQQNQAITNGLVQLGSLKQALVSAKVPNPDISTALEVLVKGSPQLPTHGFLPEEKLSPQFILVTLHRLNVAISTRMALEPDLPPPFYSYTVKDGRATFTVPGSFQCAVSLSDDKIGEALEGGSFFLVDFRLGFRSLDSKLVPAINSLPPATFRHLERFANFELAKRGLSGLYRLLHEYALFCKLYTLHRQLLQLRMGLWRGHMTHTYNAERCFIVITYWLKRKAPKSTIEIGKFGSDELGFRWIKEGQLYTSHGLSLAQDDGTIEIEGLIRRVISLHVELAIRAIQQQLVDTVENADKFCTVVYGASQLVLGVSHTRSVIYSIDLLSGDGYFKNPTPLMNSAARQINSDPKNAFLGLLRLRLEIQEKELGSVLSTTGWQYVEAVKIDQEVLVSSDQPATVSLSANLEYLKNKSLAPQLLSLRFYRRKEWPREWFLAVAVPGFSTKLQFWVTRLRSSQGAWVVLFAGSVEPPVKGQSQYSYFSLLELADVSTFALVRHLMVKELTDRGCRMKQLDGDDKEVIRFVKGIEAEAGIEPLDSSSLVYLALLSNMYLFSIPNARDSLVLVASIDSHVLTIRILGKLHSELKLDSATSYIASSVNGTSINLDRKSGVFTVANSTDLTERWARPSNRDEKKEGSSSGSPSPPGAFPATENSSSLFDSSGSASGLLSDSLSVLRRLSALLSLLQLVGRDPELTLKEVSLDRVSFQYGSSIDESITLQVAASQGSESIKIEMPPDNPHRLCFHRLGDILGDGFSHRRVAELVTYLKLTLPLYRTYLLLTESNRQVLDKFNEENNKPEVSAQDMQLTPNRGYSLSLYRAEMLKVLYYRTIDKKVDKKLKYERFRSNLKVELRHRYNKLSLRGSVYVVSVDDPYSRMIPSGTSPGYHGTSPGAVVSTVDDTVRNLQIKVGSMMGQYFSGDKTIPVGKESSVVCLKNGVACDYKCVGQVVRFLHERMQEALFSD
ncbi:DEKNAAC104155 [Brettanomyces naardenensis]|uniref:Mediator of RNA polymerase II transcription subunit 14 n=1 Tax=Brettanomyces naardenensis TaxID=13370 RepID=A0A448YQD3_BRENA|nr:DEKNAAC104155 [Brettanomyces naardenensis]